jgi:ribosomal protein S18 acetylase RimI-like enzyme
MEIVVRRPRADDQAEWARMRAALWPESSAESHAEEVTAFLTGNLTGWLAGLHAVAAFVAERPGGGLCGFLEASVRPLADGCTTHPVGYVEGWYVDPDVRRQGVGRALVGAAEAWAVSRGCREMASDANLDNAAGIAAHKALGFNDEAPTVRFRKWLPTVDGGRKAAVKTAHKLTVVPLDGTFAVCRLPPDAPLPAWAAGGPFVAITRTADELSVVCREEVVPEGVRCERGWRCLRVAGTLAFSLVGVLESLVGPLAETGVGVFAVSTFDTDYLLVKQAEFQRAVDVLLRAGHAVYS